MQAEESNVLVKKGPSDVVAISLGTTVKKSKTTKKIFGELGIPIRHVRFPDGILVKKNQNKHHLIVLEKTIFDGAKKDELSQDIDNITKTLKESGIKSFSLLHDISGNTFAHREVLAEKGIVEHALILEPLSEQVTKALKKQNIILN